MELFVLACNRFFEIFPTWQRGLSESSESPAESSPGSSLGGNKTILYEVTSSTSNSSSSSSSRASRISFTVYVFLLGIFSLEFAAKSRCYQLTGYKMIDLSGATCLLIMIISLISAGFLFRRRPWLSISALFPFLLLLLYIILVTTRTFKYVYTISADTYIHGRYPIRCDESIKVRPKFKTKFHYKKHNKIT